MEGSSFSKRGSCRNAERIRFERLPTMNGWTALFAPKCGSRLSSAHNRLKSLPEIHGWRRVAFTLWLLP